MGDGSASIYRSVRSIIRLISNYASSKSLTAADAAARQWRLQQLRKIFLRLLSIAGTQILYRLIKLNRANGFNGRVEEFVPKVRNVLAMLNLAKGYSIGHGNSRELLEWCTTLGTSLWISDFNVPTLWVTYNGLSCLISAIGKSKGQWLLESDRLKPILLNVAVVLDHRYSRQHGYKSVLAPLSLRTSFVTDTLIVYGLMGAYSLYQSGKQLFTAKTSDSKKIRQQYRDKLRALTEMGTWSRPALAKFKEIYELSKDQRSTFKDKLFSSFIVSNIGPSVQWSLYRQLCRLILGNTSHKADILLQVVMLTVGLNVIDTRRTMHVNPTLLKIQYAIQLARLINTKYKVPNTTSKVLVLVFSIINRSLHLSKTS